MAKRIENRRLYMSMGAPRMNGHLLYRFYCKECGGLLTRLEETPVASTIIHPKKQCTCKEKSMIRKMRIYKYECDNCGWVAYRGEIIHAGLCSRCGSTAAPVVSTEDREYPILPEEQARIEQAAEYVRRLQGGEDPEKLDAEIFPDEKLNLLNPLGPISSCYVAVGISKLLQQPESPVY